MASKRTPTPPAHPEEIIRKPMEDVMHESMMPYSEHVILERALPRVEDGLKPVQRRILYTMHELGNTADKPHRKCARIVGDCLGKYHPHGDSSVYEALTRMAQPFVMRTLLVDGHGNFGSIDGDSPAAMRYTEARMTEQAALMLQDIEKDTVDFHLNFDDTTKEPDLLPSRFPNLLVNGSNGIAVGLATSIPPHNLGETIDAVVAQIDKPDITTRELMAYLPAPDFPTGGVVETGGELFQAYETGRGRILNRAKVHIEKGDNGRSLIVIDEVPYQINKSAMLEKILRLSEEKKSLLGGVYDIRDESDRMGLRAVIEVKKGFDVQNILNVLYKYSDLQVTFGINMVVIADGKPRQLGIKGIIGYYIQHQKNVTTRRTKYDLQQAEARAHILEGLIIAVDNLDEVIRLIRISKNPREARERLMQAFALTEIQAQAILDMRLQRLTNLEVLALRKEYADLIKRIAELKGILASEKKLLNVIKKELKAVREKYADPRRTELVKAFDEIVIEEAQPEADETVVLLTRAGFVKRMQPKAFERSDAADKPKLTLRTMTNARLLFFTDKGNCYPVDAEKIPEATGRARDRGLAVAGLLSGLEKGENVIALLQGNPWQEQWLFVTQNGMTKRVASEEFNVRRTSVAAMKLKDGDLLSAVLPVKEKDNLLMLTRKGFALNTPAGEISLIGRTAQGIKGMTLSDGDAIRWVYVHDGKGDIILCTDKGTLKRCPLIEFEKKPRGGKGARIFPFGRSYTGGSLLAGTLTGKESFEIVQKSGARTPCTAADIPVENKSGKGVPFAVVVMDDEVTELV